MWRTDFNNRGYDTLSFSAKINNKSNLCTSF